ncbi:hypothetical protein [Marivita sp. S2033]|uniref:hypothetical protein n=1 Tax=Marivita sp. S2033 TaxID=3373187 RepID=UPI00398261B2
MTLSRSLALIPAVGLLAACEMPPQGVTPDDLANFDMAVASIGCDLVSESDYLPVELQTGLTREQVIETAQFRLATDAAVQLDNGGIRLISGPCAPA